MAEQAAVNREVVGSSPTGAAIYCRMDDWQVALTLNQGEVGTLREASYNPNSCIQISMGSRQTGKAVAL